MQKQGKTRKVFLGLAMVLVALVAFVGGTAWHPNWAPSAETVTTNKSTQQMAEFVGGDFVLPIVDRNGLTGKDLRLSDFRGKVIVLEFMAPWCPPCGDMVPVMESLYERYAWRGVVFIAVALPWTPQHSQYQNVTMTQFLSEHNSSLTYVYDSTGQVHSMYRVPCQPTLFVLSKTGSITFYYTSNIPGTQHFAYGEIAEAIREALG